MLFVLFENKFLDDLLSIINLCVAIVSLCVAFKALYSWKVEEKTKRIYLLNKNTYNILLFIQKIIKNTKNEEYVRAIDDEDDYTINNIISTQFENNVKKKLNTLYFEFSIIKKYKRDDIKYIEYFRNTINKYTERIFDENQLLAEQEFCDYETGERQKYSNELKNNFWKDYRLNDINDFQKEFDKNLDDSLMFYKEKMTEYLS